MQNLGSNADNLGTSHRTSIEVTTKQEKEMQNKPQRTHKTPAVTSVLKKSKSQFMRQVIQNNETKRSCIEKNISKHYDDPMRFWLDFNKKVGMLLDSVKFNEYCKSKNHIARQVAEHTVFEGNKFYNEIVQGRYDGLTEMAHMFNGYLFVDTEGIYDKPKQIAQMAEN